VPEKKKKKRKKKKKKKEEKKKKSTYPCKRKRNGRAHSQKKCDQGMKWVGNGDMVYLVAQGGGVNNFLERESHESKQAEQNPSTFFLTWSPPTGGRKCPFG